MFRVLIITFVFFSAISARADLHSGINLLQTGRYNEAFAELQPLALAGDMEAQYRLCSMYFVGLGVPRNEAGAADWCKLAAEKGHREAQYNLGLMYYNGEGVGQNYNQAMVWFQKAAAQGHKDAEYNAIQLYNAARASEVRIAQEQQADRARIAALNGEAPPNAPVLAAPIPMQTANTAPIGAAQPIPQPIALNPLSVQNPAGAAQIAPNAAARTMPMPVPPPVIIPQKQQKPLSYAEKQRLQMSHACLQAAQQGIIADNCKNLGSRSVDTAATTTPETSAKWFIDKAESGDAAAQNDLGVMYRRGRGVEKDDKKAFMWFEKSAAQGSTNAMLNLASMYKLGEGTEQNLELAYAWYNLGADRMQAGELQNKARQNIQEISKHLSNEQIGSALDYINKLDESIPFL
ncbi:MAG: hypothetical protein COV36_07770 [Alphaproteobacteria bacterium CG11_big_fil_rev_8_21_14_0_20_44_7]|nr:MAG: hypothetical protein COV36_07770 [Alphaproteobacteria bacterium CG11_big_fil_rev_8_21_14_0_20_44_7]